MNFDKEIENMRVSLDPQEQPPMLFCDKCRTEIYNGEEFYDTMENWLCEDCFDEWQRKEKETCKRIAGED